LPYEWVDRTIEPREAPADGLAPDARFNSTSMRTIAQQHAAEQVQAWPSAEGPVPEWLDRQVESTHAHPEQLGTHASLRTTILGSMQKQAQKLDLTDVVSASIASFRSTVDNPALMKGVESRQALKDYLDLLASAHPVKQ
jgi:hypothetical protein